MSNEEVTMTPEEEALEELLALNEEVLSEAARTLLREAYSVSHKVNLACAYYDYHPAQYEEAMQKMGLEAIRLTDRDQEHLAKIARACEAAASSIDPDDQTPAGYRYWRGDVHCYYQMISEIIDEVLQGVWWAEVFGVIRNGGGNHPNSDGPLAEGTGPHGEPCPGNSLEDRARLL
jgi:hypothetical protein